MDRGSSFRPFRPEWLQSSAWTQAWRSLWRRRTFFAAAVVTLGLGGGVATAVFSLVDTVLVKDLPYPDSDRLVTVYESSPSAREKTSLVAPGRLEDWNRLNRTFVAISGSYSENVTDTSTAEPERLEGRRVAPRFFEVYAMPTLIGRTFTSDEEAFNGPGAAVISEHLWHRRFNRDPSAVGRALVIGGRPYQIVGVVPETFTNAATDVWIPAQTPPPMLQMREARFMGGIGRIRPGIGLDEAAQDLAAVQEALGREFPRTDAGWSTEIRSLKETRIGASRRGLVLVFGAVALLWIIAVANIAGLTLVQVHHRTRELAIRSALGASRARVMGVVVREGLLIAMLGGTIAAALAAWSISVMPTLLPRTPRINEVALDWRAVAFAATTSAFAGLVFSLVPVMIGTRARIGAVLAGAGRGATGGRHLSQQLLVVAQVALSVLLVGSATLLLRSYYNLSHVATGLDPTNTLTFHVGARWDEDRGGIGRLQQQLISSLEQLPHVEAAGMASFLPGSGATLRYQARVDGLAGTNQDGSITVGVRVVSGGYLRAIKVPLVAGSWCPEPTTDFKAPQKAMVNRSLVDVHAPTQNLVGRTFRMAQVDGAPFTIVGVIGNIAEDGRGTTPAPYVYTCAAAGWWPDPAYVVRTSDPRTLATDLRRIVRELDPNRAIFGLRPLQDVLDASLEAPRLDAALLAVFAAAAVTLAAIGLYSLFMLVVSDRTRELAVRLAVGAAPQQLVVLVMTGAGRLLAGGILVGVALTVAADRVLRGVLVDASPLDPLALGVATSTLLIVSLLAVAGPALRASRIPATEALRE